MSSIHAQIADAIKAELNDTSRTWHTVLTASRTWRPWYSSPEARKALEDKIQAAVVPMTIERTRVQRPRSGNNGNEYDFGIAIDLQKIVDVALTDCDTTIDELDDIAQDIADFYQDGHTIMTGYVTMGAEREDVFNLERLYSDQIWESFIMVSVKGFR